MIICSCESASLYAHSTCLALILLKPGTKVLGIDDLWSAPALSQDPKVLRKASEGFLPNSKAGATILLNQMSFRFEEDGRLRHSVHTIYRIDKSEALHALSAVRAVWQPWHQQKPTIRARVITSEGKIHQLDTSPLVDSPAFEQRLFRAQPCTRHSAGRLHGFLSIRILGKPGTDNRRPTSFCSALVFKSYVRESQCTVFCEAAFC